MPKLTGISVEEDGVHPKWLILLNMVGQIINPLKLEIVEITNLKHSDAGMYNSDLDFHRSAMLLIVSQIPYPDTEVPEGTYVNLVVVNIPNQCKFYEITRIPLSK